MKPIKSLFGILTITAALAMQGHAQTFLTNGLVAYYPFNGSANDMAGTNNGTVYGAVLTTNRFGIVNSAYSFNGSGAYIDFGSPADLAFTSNFTLTASCLFSGGAANPRILSYSQDVGYELVTVGTGTSRSFQFDCGSHYVTTPVNYAQNVWYSVVAVVQSGTAYIYVNGVSVASGPVNTPGYTHDFQIGEKAQNNTDYWGGLIDDVRIYNRALSSNEVAQLYAIDFGPHGGLIKAVKPSFSNLTLTTNYQLQVSADMNTWTNQGSAFTATNTSMFYPQYWDVANWNSLFFRLQVAP